MRLVVKARRSHLVPVQRQVTRGGKTFMMTVYVRPSKVEAMKLHEAKGEFGVIPVPSSKTFHISAPDDKKVVLPYDLIDGMFKKFGKEFIVHKEVSLAKKIIEPVTWTVTEVRTGRRVGAFMSGSWMNAAKDAVGILDKNGIDRVLQVIDSYPDIVDAVEGSANVASFKWKPAPLDTVAKEIMFGKVAIEHHLEAIDVEEWVAKLDMSEDEIALLDVDLKAYNDVDIDFAIKYGISLDDAEEHKKAIDEVYRNCPVAVPEQVIEWAERHNIDLADVDWSNYNYSDAYGNEVDEWQIIGLAIVKDVHPDVVVEEHREGFAKIREAEKEEEKVVSLGLEGVPEYDTSKEGGYSDLSSDKAEKAVGHGHVTGMAKLGGGVNSSFRVQLSNDDECEVAFKPTSGEARSMRQGVVPDKYAEREVLAYELDKLLGLGMVPPTAMIEVNEQRGSAQYFVHDATISHEVGGKWDRLDEQDMVEAALFDYLISNTDRHGGNWMITTDFKIVLIDNGFGFPINDEHFLSPFKRHAEDSKVPKSILDVMRKTDIESFCKKMTEMGLEDTAVDGFRSRWMKVVSYHYVPEAY